MQLGARIPVIVVRAILPHTEDERLCIDLLVESQSPGSSCKLKSLVMMVKMGSSPAELVQVNTSWTSEDWRLMFTKCHWLFPPLESSYLEVFFSLFATDKTCWRKRDGNYLHGCLFLWLTFQEWYLTQMGSWRRVHCWDLRSQHHLASEHEWSEILTIDC